MAKNKKAQILAAVVCASTVLALHPVDTAKAAPTLAPVSAPTVTLDGNSYGVSTQGILDGLLDGLGVGAVTSDVLEPILEKLTATVEALHVKVGALDGLLGVQIGDDGELKIINNSYVIGSGSDDFEHMVVGKGGKFVANIDGSFGTLKNTYDPGTMTGDYLGKEENYVFHADVDGNVTAGTYNGIKISKVDADAASETDSIGDIKLDDINVSKMQNRVNELKTYTAGEGIDIQNTGGNDGDQTISVKTGAGLKIDTADKNSVAIKLKEGEKNLAVDESGLSLNKALEVDTVNGVNINKTGEGEYVFGNVNVSTINNKTQNITSAESGNTTFTGKITATDDVVAGENSLNDLAGKVANATTYTEGNGVEFTGEGKEKAINVKLKDGEENLNVDGSGLSLNKELKVDTVNGVNINKTGEGEYVFGDVNVSTINKKTQNITSAESGNTTFTGKITADDVVAGENSLNDLAGKVANATTYTEGNGVEITGEGKEKDINVKLKDGEENLNVDGSGLSLNKALKVDTVNGVNINKTETGDYVFGDVNVSVVQKDVDSVKDKTQHITADENGTHFDGNITASGDVTTGKGSSLDKVSEKLDTINGWDEDGNLIANKIAGWEYDEETGTATIAGSININKNGTISATTNADSYLDLKQDYTELGYGDNKIHLDENGIGLEAGENTSTTVTDGKVETTVGNTTVTTTQDGTKFDNGESSTVIDGGNITTDNITTDNITTSTITAGNGNFTVDKDGNVTSGSVNGVQIGTNEKGDIIINGTDNNGEVIINGSNISSSTENIAGIDRVEDGENSTTVIENNTTIDNQGNLNTVNGNFEHQITVGGENGTLITNKDVTINKGTENEISLSQMGKVDNIDKELQSNSNYDGTVVGGLNAEANIRREQVSVLNNRVNSLENRIGNVEERIDKVGAMAAAIANLRTMGYDPEAPTEIAVGIGQYKSETGLALGVFHYPNEDFMLSASLSTSGDEVMGGIGATWKLGRKTEAEKAQDIETKRLKKAEEMKIAAQKSKVEAQKERHAKMLEERQNHKTA